MYADGKWVKQDYKKAAELFEKSCNFEFAMGCEVIGTFYRTGKGVQQNISKAKKYLKKACDGGVKLSCETYRDLNKL